MKHCSTFFLVLKGVTQQVGETSPLHSLTGRVVRKGGAGKLARLVTGSRLVERDSGLPLDHGLSGSYSEPEVRFEDMASDLLEPRFLDSDAETRQTSANLFRDN